MDMMTIIMFGLIAVMIFFMFRNGKKRQQAQQEMQNKMVPGAEVMTQSGIFGVVESIDEEENRVTVRSGDSTLVLHRNAIGQVVTPVEIEETVEEIAPDDDPAFGQRIEGVLGDQSAEDKAPQAASDSDEVEKPKA